MSYKGSSGPWRHTRHGVVMVTGFLSYLKHLWQLVRLIHRKITKVYSAAHELTLLRQVQGFRKKACLHKRENVFHICCFQTDLQQSVYHGNYPSVLQPLPLKQAMQHNKQILLVYLPVQVMLQPPLLPLTSRMASLPCGITFSNARPRKRAALHNATLC